MRKKLSALLLLFAVADVAALDVPVADMQQWTTLTFNRITPNTVSVEDGSMHIAVRGSASPLVHKLDTPREVTAVTVRGHWSGELQIPAAAVQGDEIADDFVLKLGIVQSGDKTLNWFQRKVAANWIKQLFRLAPKGTGVDRINFLSTTRQEALLGSERVHPLSDLLYETRVTWLEAPGDFVLSHEFAEPVAVLGLWISSDGDNTGSSFDLQIDSIELSTE